jgi:tetratricopeptide (TPR) repeat protein
MALIKDLPESPDFVMELAPATDGEIAVINLKSALQASWRRFWRDPARPGVAELIVEQEQLAAQYLGDLSALDRLETLVNQFIRADAESSRIALVQAQFASMTHRFAQARDHAAKAELLGAPSETISRLSLSIDQACGTHLDSVHEKRRRMCAESEGLEDLVPLGSLLADLGEFTEADRTYRRALQVYQDVSPFAVAWVCFQLGALWGEIVPEPELNRAAQWYRKAIDYLPCYVRARVHLAEIHSSCGRCGEAESLLVPVVNCGDPEVAWRLADVMNATGRFAEAEAQLQAARTGFEALLDKHELAFADHGAEFYAGSGGNPARAFELAQLNLANRPTLRAFEQAYATATAAGEANAASEILAAARSRWGATMAFRLSSLGVLLSEGALT